MISPWYMRIVYGFVVGVSVAVLLGTFHIAKADSLYQDGYADPEYWDISFACNGNPQYINLSQRIYGTDANTSFVPVQISKFRFKATTTGTCGNGNGTDSCELRFYNQYADNVATSTESFTFIPNDGEQIITIDPPFIASPTNPLEKISINCDGEIFNRPFSIGTSRMTYTENYCGLSPYCPSGDYELAMQLYSSQDTLRLTRPRNEAIRGTFTVGGTCLNDVRFCLSNAFNIASSTSAFCLTDTCSTGVWSSPQITNLETLGAWFVTASSTESGYEKTDASIFTYISNSPLPTSNPLDVFFNTATTSIPTFNATDQVMGATVDLFLGLRPFSYIRDVYDIAKRSMVNASSSTSFSIGETISATTSPYFNGNFTLFSRNTFESIVSPTAWSPFRTITEAILWLVFGFYLFKRVKSFL